MPSDSSTSFSASYDSTTKIISAATFVLLLLIVAATHSVGVGFLSALLLVGAYAGSPRGYTALTSRMQSSGMQTFPMRAASRFACTGPMADAWSFCRRKATARRFFSKPANPKNSCGKCGRRGPAARDRNGLGSAPRSSQILQLIYLDTLSKKEKVPKKHLMGAGRLLRSHTSAT